MPRNKPQPRGKSILYRPTEKGREALEYLANEYEMSMNETIDHMLIKRQEAELFLLRNSLGNYANR